MTGNIQVCNSEHDVVEERYFYTWEGMRKVVTGLMESHSGFNRYIQVSPNIVDEPEKKRAEPKVESKYIKPSYGIRKPLIRYTGYK